MEILAAGAEALGNDHWRVRLVVQNTGWLPSYVSKRALERKVVRGVIAEIALPPGARRCCRASAAKSWDSSKARRTSTPGCRSGPIDNVTDDRAKVEWIVRAESRRRDTAHGAARSRGNRAHHREARVRL